MATEASWIQKELIVLIGAAMEVSGLSARELAERAGIPFTTLARKLVGDSDFSFAELYEIARIVQLPPSLLVPRATAIA